MAETQPIQSWLEDIAAYDRAYKPWCGRVEKILTRYRDDKRKTTSGTKFNILWSNVQTLVPACFSKLPQSDVSRRFRDTDPVGRVSALILERGLEFELQHYPDYRATMRQCVQDRFLGGRGTAWARYEPHFLAVEEGLPADGSEVSEDIDEPNEELDYECAPVDYVHWKDFGHSVARTWEEVTRVWRKVYMRMPAKIERFGEELAKKIPLDAKPRERNEPGESDDGSWIYEGWDKDTLTAVWFSKGIPEFLDERPDPLGLEGFFPCPRPLYATLTNDSLIPVPDYKLYEDQAEELNTLADRIDGLIQALKVTGVYSASVPSLARLFTEGTNGTLIPVDNWAAFVEKNGLQGAIDLVDLKPIADALKAAYEAFAQVIQFIYEITGLSDIIRGQTDPNETLGAQEMKGRFASLRLRDSQEDVALFATGLMQLKAQIMCAKFRPETLLEISAAKQLSPDDQQYIPQAMQLLIGDRANPEMPTGQRTRNPLRSFRIEVAADTLVQLDEQAEKQSAVEFVTAVTGYLKQAGEIAMQAPQLAPLLMDLLKFAAQRFKVGKTIEGSIDQAADQLKQMAMQPKPPDPKLEADKLKAQVDMEKSGVEKQKIQAEAQTVPIKARAEEMKAQAAVTKAGIELQTAQVQATMPPPVVMPQPGRPQ